MRRASRITAVIALVLTSLSLAGCNGNVGVGVSVGVPVGNHGYVSVGGTRWR
jgi:predicted small secreted protein